MKTTKTPQPQLTTSRFVIRKSLIGTNTIITFKNHVITAKHTFCLIK